MITTVCYLDSTLWWYRCV